MVIGGREYQIFIEHGYAYNCEGDKSKDETIHIYSVASGHLYERFLKIMMLSIRKRYIPVVFDPPSQINIHIYFCFAEFSFQHTNHFITSKP